MRLWETAYALRSIAKGETYAEEVDLTDAERYLKFASFLIVLPHWEELQGHQFPFAEHLVFGF